jgi:hypothetical protein
MKKYVLIYILFAVISGTDLFSQSRFKTVFPGHCASIQFAGSVGFLSAGYHISTKKEKLEIGIVYGHTPLAFGGPLHSVSLKFLYNPFKLNLGNYFSFEPVQTGIFIAQNFGKNLYLTWPDKYPKQYYWWANSLREHIFLSSTLSLNLQDKMIEKISCYFEANTNDLYLYSYFPNRTAIKLYDIVFFGIGTKVWFR